VTEWARLTVTRDGPFAGPLQREIRSTKTGTGDHSVTLVVRCEAHFVPGELESAREIEQGNDMPDRGDRTHEHTHGGCLTCTTAAAYDLYASMRRVIWRRTGFASPATPG
jgi:hypothetical protein